MTNYKDFEIELDPRELLKLPRNELVARAEAKRVYDIRKSKLACEESLIEFVRQSWHVIEPSQPFVDGWALHAIAMHLEATAEGEIIRLMINVPPGFSKSTLTSVMLPAWIWGPRNEPSTRFLATSHAQKLAIRDSLKTRRLITSQWYQERWGDRVKLTGDQASKVKFENTATGFREALAFESMTGSRGDIVILDDPHSVDSAASEAQRESTITTFLEALPTRLNDPVKSKIIIIMQRLHEGDVSGVVIEKNLGYTHLMLPMEYDPSRHCETEIGFSDPRTEEGELLFPERFPKSVVDRERVTLGPYAYAGQYQQAPSPRGGGIIKRDWWSLYDDEVAKTNGIGGAHKYPPMDYIVASLDGAYTSKQENDPSALTVWGVWQRGGQSARRLLSRDSEVSDLIDDRDTIPSVMLMYAWEKRLPIHGPNVERMEGETDAAFRIRQRENMGLVEHVIETCNKYNVDMLLIEAKGPGLSVAQEIKRLNRTTTWGVELINPGNADKVARTYAVQPIFSNGAVFTPDRDWSDKVITQFEVFPKGKHDDLVDSCTQALRYLRERNLIRRPEEVVAAIKNEGSHQSIHKPIYDV